jgi:hypothetical protein
MSNIPLHIIDQAKKAQALASYTYHCLYGFTRHKTFYIDKEQHGVIAYNQVINAYIAMGENHEQP